MKKLKFLTTIFSILIFLAACEYSKQTGKELHNEQFIDNEETELNTNGRGYGIQYTVTPLTKKELK